MASILSRHRCVKCHFSHLPWKRCHFATMNYSHHRVWDEITYPSQNFNGCTVEVWGWISNFIRHVTGHAITYPCSPVVKCSPTGFTACLPVGYKNNIYKNGSLHIIGKAQMSPFIWWTFSFFLPFLFIPFVSFLPPLSSCFIIKDRWCGERLNIIYSSRKTSLTTSI